MRAWCRRAAAGVVLCLFSLGAWAAAVSPPKPADAALPAADEAAPVALSAGAQRAFQTTRAKLLQVRTLLKDQDSQASVGSGFIVSPDGHVITNYHVVSQMALEPKRYRLTYARADGSNGKLDLLAFDAIHDLALLRMVPVAGGPVAAFEALSFRPHDQAIGNGERIYSLGNPLDIGFAVIEGNYNGLAGRSFYPQLFFAGALNPGMSGGPALDGQGRVIGVNVSTRLGGQELSFLVPAQFAEDLLMRGRDAAPLSGDAYPELTRQLLAHQQGLVGRFLAQSWRSAGNPRYQVPVPQEEFMRCWGSSSTADSKGMEFQSSNCEMESGGIFISGALRTGDLGVTHRIFDGSRLGPLRFARAYSTSFGSGQGAHGAATTAPSCKERFVDRGGLPLRAVVCLAAYRKLPGLFDLSVQVATVDDGTQGVQGRLSARGVDFDNALRLTEHYLQGYAWNASH